MEHVVSALCFCPVISIRSPCCWYSSESRVLTLLSRLRHSTLPFLFNCCTKASSFFFLPRFLFLSIGSWCFGWVCIFDTYISFSFPSWVYIFSSYRFTCMHVDFCNCGHLRTEISTASWEANAAFRWSVFRLPCMAVCFRWPGHDCVFFPGAHAYVGVL
ncbi:hypothetical protein L228DRAFT_151687 [Xylona heveae TC161]|uniref:Uncharacterized protein n=1 Tax=Xylona heveae (strain CBS 132557 / TC161) TaxID=1328760 RepID=A0A165GNA4_XYLHT|nr:hypothetical protein L228DRAFT_151687 [Xylona heveae TC161]KZF22397.1 hypothetical protein L228DRAFT_151687 [Xylona heveae TC161]